MAGETVVTGSPEVMDTQQPQAQQGQQTPQAPAPAQPQQTQEQFPTSAYTPGSEGQFPPSEYTAPSGALSGNTMSPTDPNNPANHPGGTTTDNYAGVQAPAPPHRAFASKVLGVLSDMLGGYTHGNPTYSYDENGKMITTPGDKLSTGKMIMKGVGAALGGLGASANVRGPGAAWRSLGAGFEGEQAKSIAMTERAKEQASTEFKARETAARDKASILHLQAETASLGWTMQRSQQEVDEKSLENNEIMKQLVAADPAHNQDLGHFNTWQEYLKNVPKQQQDQMIADAHNGLIRTTYDTQGGKITGMHFYKINPDWGAQKNSDDVSIAYQTMKDGKPVWDHFTVPTGSMRNDVLAKYLQQSTTDSLKEQQEQETRRHNKAEEAHQAEATQAGLESEAMKSGTAEPMIGAGGKVTGVQANTLPADPFGAKPDRTINRNEYNKRDDQQLQFRQKTLDPVEKSYQMFEKAYADHKRGTKTGAEGMVALSTHLNTTFGSVKGARVTKDMIHEHLSARNITDDMLVAVNKLKNGDPLSNKQWDAFHQLISQSRAVSWQQAGDSARNAGIPRTFYPKPAKMDHSMVPNPSTAQLYMDAAGGDVKLANQAMQAQGWK